jgi:hypothetical protein
METYYRCIHTSTARRSGKIRPTMFYAPSWDEAKQLLINEWCWLNNEGFKIDIEYWDTGKVFDVWITNLVN